MGRRKQTEAELNWRRAQILKAAAKVFVAAGFHGAKMETIAGEAGCSAATIYSYFNGKDALFEGVMDELSREMLALIQAPMPPGLDLRQSLFWTLQRLGEFADRNQQLLLTYLVQAGDLGHRETQDDVHLAFVAHYKALFDAAQKRGEVRAELDTAELAVAFEGMISAVAIKRIRSGASIDAGSGMIDLFLSGAAARPRR